jgi:hypothetical protein
MVVEKNQNSCQKPRWRHVDYFFNKNSTKTPSSGFVRNIFLTQIWFLKIQNGGVIFEKILLFFQKGPSHPKHNFFQILKKQSWRPKTQDIKIESKEKFQDGGYFQIGVWPFFSYEPLFWVWEVIFGLSHYFLMLNYKK